MSAADKAIPVMPLREVVIFPQNVLPLVVGRQSSINAALCAWQSPGKQFFLITQKNSATQNPGVKDLYNVGVVARILQVLHLPDQTIKILCEGLYRATFANLEEVDGICSAIPIPVQEIEASEQEILPLVTIARESLDNLEKNGLEISQESLLSIQALRKPGELADAIMPLLQCGFAKKQEILEIADTGERLEKTCALLEAELSFATVEKRIKNRVKMQMEHNQREYYLSEQLKAINREMGREDDPQAEIEALEEQIKAKLMPVHARDKALSECHKLRALTPAAAEYAVSRNYIDWILDLPWDNHKDIEIDIEKARQILDGEHYGLRKAKERILEYLAVQKLSHGLKGPILCFVGPPGVGKTSLAASIARATGREFARLSLGGVRDEAEIRGHRRTYVGALPGKIIQSLKRVKTNNPLFCLDEIDKIASDYRGDPASALLEALDPEQNNAFMDHYLDLEYDLSNIFFITTANSLQTIPAPLLDRMEIIELPSYLETEKRHIGRQFLLPRQIAEHGLHESNLRLSENALLEIIRRYTSESGVRNLNRELATICRKTAMQLVENNDLKKQVSVSVQNLPIFLGNPKYRHEERENEPRVGVCAGLAYNQSGGEILFVETSLMHGSGQIVTTGKLGEVMTESARAALTYVRSRAEALGLTPEFYKNIDIHVHVPSGATPKDGPSAGITLATSITSALLGLPVRNDVAMTGEISLRGRVLPIGGLREKLLAAKRAGIRTVILPKDNQKDLDEVPEEILRNLELVFVENVDDVLPRALAATKDEIFSAPASTGNLVDSLKQKTVLPATL